MPTNYGSIHGRIGWGGAGIQIPTTATAGSTPVKLAHDQNVTSTSSTNPSFPAGAQFTVRVGGTYRLYYSLAASASRTGTTSSTTHFYFVGRVVRGGEVEQTIDIDDITTTISGSYSGNTASRMYETGFMVVQLQPGDTLKLGGYMSNSGGTTHTATILMAALAAEWDNGF